MSSSSAQPAGVETNRLTVVSAAVNGVLVGASAVAVRFVIDQSAPASLACLRYAIASCCLVPFVLAGRRARFAPRDLLPIALLGIGQFGIQHVLLNYALQFIPAARAALLIATFPLQVLVIAALVGHERITLAKTIGIVLTIGGVGLALGDKALGAGAGTSWNGEIAALLGATAGAVTSVAFRPYVRRYPVLPLGAFAMSAAVPFLAILAGLEEGFFRALPHFTAAGWGAVAFVGVASGVGYGLWLWGLSRIAATRVTVFLALSPFTATALGAWLLGERVSALFAMGLIAVAGGLWLANLPEAPLSRSARAASAGRARRRDR